MKKITSLFLTTLLAVQLFAQLSDERMQTLLNSDNKQDLVFESTQLLQNNMNFQAELLTRRLLELEPNNCNFNYRMGYILMASRGNFIAAEKHLLIAVKDVDKNYDVFSAKEQSASVDAYFYLGQMYHMKGEIDQARVYYNLFLKNSVKNTALAAQVKLQLLQCDVAQRELDTPDKNMVIRNIGKTINTNFAEYSPVISLDGKSLYFTTRRPWDATDISLSAEPKEDVYFSVLDENDSWTTPKRLEFCQEYENEASVAVSADERRIYLYRDATGRGDIYFSDFSSNQFSLIAKDDRDKLNFDNAWETHCSVTLDGKTIFFVSDRKGGYGGRDIYRMDRLADGGWSEPKNMGPTINSKYDEDGAFIAIDNKTLYFSSNGETSMGGFDVFVTKMNDKGEWSTPKNLGYPLNTCGDELYYTTTLDGRKGYLTSYRADGFGEKDIYEIAHNYTGLEDISYLEGTIKTIDNLPLPEDMGIHMRCLNCDPTSPNIEFNVLPRLRDGSLFANVDAGKQYEIVYYHAGGTKVMHTDTILTDNTRPIAITRFTTLLDVREMKIIPEEKPVDLPEIVAVDYKIIEFKYFFDYNSNKLSPKKGDFKKFMKEVEQQLADGREKVTISIYSSASTVPTKKFKNNNELASSRAENVKYDIVEYVQKNEKYQGRINVVIVESKVDGPAYEQDNFNKEKYRAFQYIYLKTE